MEVEYPHVWKRHVQSRCVCALQGKNFNNTHSWCLRPPLKVVETDLRCQYWHVFSFDLRDVYATAPDLKMWCQKTTTINQRNLKDAVKFEVSSWKPHLEDFQMQPIFDDTKRRVIYFRCWVSEQSKIPHWSVVCIKILRPYHLKYTAFLRSGGEDQLIGGWNQPIDDGIYVHYTKYRLMREGLIPTKLFGWHQSSLSIHWLFWG